MYCSFKLFVTLSSLLFFFHNMYVYICIYILLFIPVCLCVSHFLSLSGYLFVSLSFFFCIKHELLLFHKTVVVTCEQLVKMEVHDSDWTVGLPLHPPKGITPSPPPWEVNSNGASLLCRERMTPIGIFESEDQIGASPTASPVLPRNNTSLSSCKLLVVSVERYNRHCAVFKRLGQFAYDMIDQPLVQAMGGIPSPKEPTMLAFCRKTFRDGALEKSIMGAEGN